MRVSLSYQALIGELDFVLLPKMPRYSLVLQSFMNHCQACCPAVWAAYKGRFVRDQHSICSAQKASYNSSLALVLTKDIIAGLQQKGCRVPVQCGEPIVGQPAH